MSLAESLLDPDAYPHSTERISCVETHMSWVFLTGRYAYKVKKPVKFEFADFSQMSSRELYCRRELDLNSAFAPEIYVDVVPVFATHDGIKVGQDSAYDGGGDAANVTDWAVKMRQFPPEAVCDRLLTKAALPMTSLQQFGANLATQHEGLPIAPYIPIEAAALENFRTMRTLGLPASIHRRLHALETETSTVSADLKLTMQTRASLGRCRACHGDLHLGNLVMLGDEVKAFDCLEFNDQLSQTDVWADVAFLFMDLATRGFSAYGYAFVDGYLSASADYEGVALLSFFSTYRAMVRAKVAALRYQQQPKETLLSHIDSLVRWAHHQLHRPEGRIIITHGLSGSGKSYWSKQLVESMGCIRIRSDLLRKSLAGFSATERTESDLGAGLYSGTKSTDLYLTMADLAVRIARTGETVIVDAASLTYEQRQILRTTASASNIATILVSFCASPETLKARVTKRQTQQTDPSEADEAVLQWQMDHQEPTVTQEHPITFDTEAGTLETLIERVNARN